MAFLDPPKASASEALSRLNEHKVAVKILTGDNDIVTGNICQRSDCRWNTSARQPDRGMDEAQLGEAAEVNTVFAKLSPSHKERIITPCRAKGT